MKPEIYVSIDIETDGPCPGLNSMLALGAAAFDDEGNMAGTWYSTLEPLTGAEANAETIAWWQTQPEAWEEVCRNQKDPADAMKHFARWCEALKRAGTLIPVAKPAGFDYPFVLYYLHLFAGRNPLGIACLDLRSYTAGLMGSSRYRPADMRKWILANTEKPDLAGLRPHVAVDDAIEQGRIFMALRKRAMDARARQG
jgi:hypothetical protein